MTKETEEKAPVIISLKPEDKNSLADYVKSCWNQGVSESELKARITQDYENNIKYHGMTDTNGNEVPLQVVIDFCAEYWNRLQHKYAKAGGM